MTLINRQLFLACLLCLAALFFAAGCSSPQPSPIHYRTGPDETPRSMATAAHDTLILTRIKSKLASDDLVDPGEIRIRVRHQVAILEGYARDVYHRRMVINLVRTVDGVVRVEDRMGLIHPPTPY